ncbi:MAG: decarboxylating NADP(+)-dependent phosphogluconate dehydrogenase [Clostridiaceae bacterium]|jgi:6-phosphogluconate dehydrogenase|nr:decarboxylating NADP(+)-dependent phosphogluconate dehydrogenase [Clostridiaceae bacterium]
MKQAQIGLIGLAVMGENLAMNMLSKGFTVAVYNRTQAKVSEFVSGRARQMNVIGCYSVAELVRSLAKPRLVMMMIKAGQPVDDMIDELIPLLDPGDIIIDGGNAHFMDTRRRVKLLENQGFYFIGTGISGGEEGALKGPSIMPGGSHEAWPAVKPIFQSIAAKASDGAPCCEWIGPDGAGHFVKMVHNGIEYGDMQIISEAYHLMRDGLSLSAEEMQDIFRRWNETELNSYLIEITAAILGVRNAEGSLVLDTILDAAGQKGTGQWTSQTALDLGVPLDLINEAVFTRYLSALKEERVAAAAIYNDAGIDRKLADGQTEIVVESIRQAVYAAKIVSYAQGYALMQAAARLYNWPLDYAGIAMIWREGCIIRSVLLEKIRQAFTEQEGLKNLLTATVFHNMIASSLPAWREVVSRAVEAGIPVPALSAGLNYFHGYISDNLPANLIQAQRDFFGAHTYERIDAPRGQFFHTEWND